MTGDEPHLKPSSPHQFRFCPRVLHGAGSLAGLSGVLDSSHKYLIVTDERISTAGLTERVCDLIAAAEVEYEVSLPSITSGCLS